MIPVIATVLTFLLASQAVAHTSAIKVLNEIEKKYAASSGIQMDVTKKLSIPLLEREKISEGTIKIKKGGRFKWETLDPEKSTILLTSEAVWVIDYPLDEMDKTLVMKSKKPKKNQSPAIVTFLMGQGGLTKNYKIVNSESRSGNREIIKMKAKSPQEVAKELTLLVDKKEKTVVQVSFIDALGNDTTLDFKNIKFNQSFKNSEFKFSAPKDAEITVVE